MSPPPPQKKVKQLCLNQLKSWKEPESETVSHLSKLVPTNKYMVLDPEADLETSSRINLETLTAQCEDIRAGLGFPQADLCRVAKTHRLLRSWDCLVINCSASLMSIESSCNDVMAIVRKVEYIACQMDAVQRMLNKNIKEDNDNQYPHNSIHTREVC